MFRHQSASVCSVAFDPKDAQRLLDFVMVAAAPVEAVVTKSAGVLFVVAKVDPEDAMLLVTEK